MAILAAAHCACYAGKERALDERRSRLKVLMSMRDYTTKEKVKITTGAISAVITVGLLAAIALALLWSPPP